jgi:hypothetical protein
MGCETEQHIHNMQKLLRQFSGKRVSVHLQRGGSDVVYQGILEPLGDINLGSCWTILVNRTLLIDPRTRTQRVLPETKASFFAKDVWYIVEELETREEATNALQDMTSPIIT